MNRRRACVFCQATDQKISKEHVFPKWLRKVIEGGEEGLAKHGRIIKARDGETLWEDIWEDIPINYQVAAPCRPCNEGWMEAIEAETRPILTPLIQHQDAELGPLEKETLARWATLRVMMAQYLDPAERPKAIPKERYHRFYEARELPPKAQIWMARRNGEGAWPLDSSRKELFIGMERPPFPNAYISAFAVGHVAFVYWGHEVEDGATVRIGDGMKPFLLPIWPDINLTSWPPRGLLGARGLDTVVKNLVRTS
ncbi:MAG TPA: hypothetical protein VFY48_08045 [Solirubrobacterales bacterium]|nr:hypothetical protein [Solirubrobacterales bacterium]